MNGQFFLNIINKHKFGESRRLDISFGCGAPNFNALSIIFDFFIKISPEALVLGPIGDHQSIQRGKLHKIDMGAINCWGIILRAKCFTPSGSLIMLQYYSPTVSYVGDTYKKS